MLRSPSAILLVTAAQKRKVVTMERMTQLTSMAVPIIMARDNGDLKPDKGGNLGVALLLDLRIALVGQLNDPVDCLAMQLIAWRKLLLQNPLGLFTPVGSQCRKKL
jgi:hypothetical protein